jgi:hypothetical protein
MPARSTFVGSTPPMSEPAEPTRCQAVITVKGKRCCCDQPATVERGGHAVCLKHDRVAWIEYPQPALPRPRSHQRDGACARIATKLLFLQRNRSFRFTSAPACS